MTASGNNYFDDLNNAVRANPISAALIGIGAAWLFLGNKIPVAVGKQATSAITSATQTVVDTTSKVASGASDGVSVASSKISDMTDAGRKTVGEAVESIKGYADGGSEFAKSQMGQLQQRFGKAVESQPLYLGVVGLVIGAAAASAFTATKLERKVLGEYADKALDSATDLANQAGAVLKERAGEVVSVIGKEAQARGFTADGAKETLADAADKIKQLSQTARTSFNDRLPTKNT